MTMSEVEVDRITQRVFQAHNSGLNGALVKVVIDEIEKATEGLFAEVKALRQMSAAHDAICRPAADRLAARASDAEDKVARVEALLTHLHTDLVYAGDVRAALGGDS